MRFADEYETGSMFYESGIPLSAGMFQPGTVWIVGLDDYTVGTGHPVDEFWQDPAHAHSSVTVNAALPVVSLK